MNRTRTSKNAKRLLVWLLLLTMVFGLLPMAAFADEAVVEPIVSEEPVQETEPSSESTEAPSEPTQEPTQEPEPEQPGNAVVTIEGDEEQPEEEMLAEEISFNYAEKGSSKPLTNNGIMGYRIVHIDCGRKYFSYDDLTKIIDYAADYGYTHVELAFGNDGLRFLLNDMSVKVGDVSYDSSAVADAIRAGNGTYAHQGELSESEMTALIRYASGRNIGIIPMFDAPGHMQVVIRAMKTLGLNPKYSAIDTKTYANWAIDTTDAASVNFVLALVQKYITYFANSSCTMFNIAGDECGFAGMSQDQYTAYAKFINSLAESVQNAGMTALAFNDGIYHQNLATDVLFDTNIAICYWDASEDKYASASTLAGISFKIINTHNKWYYVIGNEDDSWFGFKWAQGYMNGENKDCRLVDSPANANDKYYTDIGCMLAIWCDDPNATVNWNNVNTHIKTLSDNNKDYFIKQTTPETPEIVISVEPTGEIKVGDAITLTLSNYEDNVSWSCEPAGVLELSSAEGTDITAKALKVGTATVTAAMADGKTATISITVAETVVDKTENITLVVGASSEPYVQDKLHPTVENEKLVNDDGTVVASYTLTHTPGTEYKFTAVHSVSANGTYYISTEKGYLTADGGTTDDLSKAAAWTLIEIKNGSYKGAYYLQNGDCYLKYDNGSWTTTTSNISGLTPIYFNNGTFYRTRYSYGGYYYYEDSLGVPGTRTGDVTEPKTNIVFKGLAVGTTSVIIGNVEYNITVEAEDLSNVTPLPIQLWITNNTIEAYGDYAGKTTGSGWTGTGNEVRFINVPAAAKKDNAKINSEQGMTVVDAFAALGMGDPITRYEFGGTRYIEEQTNNSPAMELTFWTGRIHDSSNIQDVWNTDYSNSGEGFTFVRYWGKQWQVSADRQNWTTVTGEGSTGTKSGCKEQLVAYYMTRTEITKEITTEVADWGKPKDGTEYDSQVRDNFVLLDFAVAYQGGTRVPTGFPVSGKTLAYHCATNDSSVGKDGSYYYRRLNNFRAVETGDFEVYMVTVTMTSADGGTMLSSSAAQTQNGYTYDKTTEQIIWAIDEDTRVASGLENYLSISGSDIFSGCKIGGEPNIRGVEVYNKHGALITYYIRAKQTVTDKLTVNYYVDGETKPFYTYDIVVDANTTFDPNFARTVNPVGLEYNTVVNSVNETETVNWKLELLPQISSQYRYTDYEFVRTDFTGNDYKVVNLYYTFNAEKTFVVDFGLPLVITPGDVNTNLAANGVSLTKVEVSNVSSYARVTTDDNCNVTYTLKEMIGGKDTFGLQYSGTLVTGNNTVQEGQSAKYSITIMPASNVYYEDSFAQVKNGVGLAAGATWVRTTNDESARQALTELGKAGDSVYGYDSAYANSTMFSMNGYSKVAVSSDMASDTWDANKDAWPTATFTFTGTGFDIISLTDNQSGAIYVDVYKGKGTSGTREKSYIVNNYYGYEFTNGKWEISKNADTLYQIPVMKITDLDYGEYTAVITVFYDGLFDNAGKNSYSFWLDAIRVYDPMGENVSDYTQDKEGYPQYIKLRDKVATGAAGVNEELLFIDGAEKATVELYKNYGPNNEVYLAKGQAISFKITGDNIDKIQIGAKAPSGTTELKVNDVVKIASLNSATEMYYDISTEAKNQQVTITNTSGNILSLTNIKVTFTNESTASLAALSADDEAQAVAMVRALFAPPVVETFVPERFEASWSSNVREGSRAVLTVKTSEDVEAIMVDGETVTNYRTRTERTGWGWNAKRVTYREFTYMVSNAQNADYTVIAVNADDVQSEPIVAALSVKPARPARPGWGWLDDLFGRWF